MIFRVARHSHNIQQLTEFYVDVLGLQVLGGFSEHDSYNGVFLGIEGQSWHLEFTESDQPANHHFDEDDLLVFYPLNQSHYNKIVERIRERGIALQEPKNPYWRENGIQINDPDGYGVIVSGLRIDMPTATG